MVTFEMRCFLADMGFTLVSNKNGTWNMLHIGKWGFGIPAKDIEEFAVSHGFKA